MSVSVASVSGCCGVAELIGVHGSSLEELNYAQQRARDNSYGLVFATVVSLENGHAVHYFDAERLLKAGFTKVMRFHNPNSGNDLEFFAKDISKMEPSEDGGEDDD